MGGPRCNKDLVDQPAVDKAELVSESVAVVYPVQGGSPTRVSGAASEGSGAGAGASGRPAAVQRRLALLKAGDSAGKHQAMGVRLQQVSV